MIQLLFIIFIITKSINFIKNENAPICTNCIHFIKHKNNNPESNDLYGRCKLFGEKNIINGEITYKYASICRDNEELCDEDGKYHET